jgi:hypothetical protein
VATLPANVAVGVALSRIAARIWPAEARGAAAASSAIVPVTWGAAIEVPLYQP